MAMAFALALAVPIGTLIYIWVATIWGGALELRAATWYALLAISTMACGLAGELAYSVIPVGWALDNTTASQGDTLYVLVGGGVIGGFAALHYWFPKLGGRLLGEGVGKVALVLMTIGIHLYVIPMFFAGLEGQPVDVFKFYEDTGPRRLQPGRLDRRLRPRRSGSWSSSATPPTAGTTGCAPAATTRGAGRRSSGSRSRRRPPHNFDAVPDVRSPEPLHDIRESIARRERGVRGPAAARAGRRAGAGCPSPRRHRRARRPAPSAEPRLRRRRKRPGSLKAMSAVAARGDAAELARFRRLVTLTIAATFALILIGGIVRVSDSGLGCGAAGSGTHGWPLCEGGVLPADSAESVDRVQPPGRGDGRHGADRAARLARLAPAAPAPPARPRLDRARSSSCWRRRRSAGSRSSTGSRTSSSPPTSGSRCSCSACSSSSAAAPSRPRRRRPSRSAACARSALVTCGLVLATIVAGGYVAGTEYHGTERPAAGRARTGLRHRLEHQPVPGLQRPGRAVVRPVAARRHPADPPAFMYLTAISVIALAALALRRRAPQPRLLDRAPAARRPDRARGDQRLGRQARRADRRPPGARDDAVGDGRLRRPRP